MEKRYFSMRIKRLRRLSFKRFSSLRRDSVSKKNDKIIEKYRKNQLYIFQDLKLPFIKISVF